MPGPESIASQLTRIFPRRDRLLIDGYRPTESTGSDACFSLAKHWINTCCKTHTTCKRFQLSGKEHDWKPTRLIKVDPQNNHLKLCEYNQLSPRVEYVTLSHCWGKNHDKSINLTNENIKSFQKELPDLQHSQTFKDAITATRKLGFEYIWIDSLCIIQNSDKDWEKEASQMGFIYKYSACTITATSAEDDTGGCFFDRKLEHSIPARITVESTPSRSVTFDVNCLAQVHWKADVEEAPVNQRGWVLQERLLSPRLLHYNKNQLYWECNEMLASESYPWGFSNIRGESEPARSSLRISTNLSSSVFLRKPHTAMHAPSALPSNIQGVFRRGLIKTWMDIVTFYTKSELTFKMDKLIAISAIARELRNTQQSAYLAGLWECDLIFELGWMSNFTSVPRVPWKDGKETKVCYDDFGKEVFPRETLYLAPSWSWASLDGSVTYPYNDEIIGSGNNYPLISDIESSIELKDEDAFGKVTGGYLTALAQMVEVKLTVDRTITVAVHGSDILTPGSVSRDEFDKSSWPESEEVYLMPLLLCLFDKDRFLFTGILLEPTTTAEGTMPQNVFKRTGAINWQASKAALERDPGLRLLLALIGKIEWNVEYFPSFHYDTRRGQRIKVV